MVFSDDYQERALANATEAFMEDEGDRRWTTLIKFIELEIADVHLANSERRIAMNEYWDKVRSMEAKMSLHPLMMLPENMQLVEWQCVEQRIENGKHPLNAGNQKRLHMFRKPATKG